MSKRKFDKFQGMRPQGSRQPQSVSAPGPGVGDPANNSDQGGNRAPPLKDFQEQPIKDLVAAGWDIESIKGMMFGLTNELHPMFAEENFCACRHRDQRYCYIPIRMEAALAVNTGGALTPIWEHPHDSFIIRSILQLATRIVTHPDTLPFWDALITNDQPLEDQEIVCHVRHNEKPNLKEVRQVDQELKEAASHVRFHFKKFVHLDPPEVGENPDDGGSAVYYLVEEDHPANVPGKASKLVYSWKNGGPAVDEDIFTHIWINTSGIESFDLTSDQWMDHSMSFIRRHAVHTAAVICHELAHAIVNRHFEHRDPYFNDETLLEPGYALENFVFGGRMDVDDDDLWIIPWPDRESAEKYPRRGSGIHAAALPPKILHILEKDDWESVLRDEFWDEEGYREGRIKKLWLRKY